MTSTSEPRRTGVRFKWCRPTRGIGFRTLTTTSSPAVARSTAVSQHSKSISKSKRKNEKCDRHATGRPLEDEAEPSGEQEPITYGFNARFSVSRSLPSASSSTSGSNTASSRYISSDNSPLSSPDGSPEDERAVSPMSSMSAALGYAPPYSADGRARGSRSRSRLESTASSTAVTSTAVSSFTVSSHDDSSDFQASAMRAESPYQFSDVSASVRQSTSSSPTSDSVSQTVKITPFKNAEQNQIKATGMVSSSSNSSAPSTEPSPLSHFKISSESRLFSRRSATNRPTVAKTIRERKPMTYAPPYTPQIQPRVDCSWAAARPIAGYGIPLDLDSAVSSSSSARSLCARSSSARSSSARSSSARSSSASSSSARSPFAASSSEVSSSSVSSTAASSTAASWNAVSPSDVSSTTTTDLPLPAEDDDNSSDSQSRAASPYYNPNRDCPAPVRPSTIPSPSPPRSFSPTLEFLATQLATPYNGPPPSYYSPSDNRFETVNHYPTVDGSLVSGTYPPFDAPFARSRADPFASMSRDALFSPTTDNGAFANRPMDSTSRDNASRAASPAPPGSDSNASTWSASTPASLGSESLGPSLSAITAAGRWSPAIALPVWSADCPAPSWNAEPAWSPASRATPWNRPASHANHWSAASQRSHWNGNASPFSWDPPPPSSLWSGSSPASLWSGSAPSSLWNNSGFSPWRAPYASSQYKNPVHHKKMKKIYKSKKPLTLACHTSEYGVAAVLTRNLENGEEYEISVDMRTFLVCERRYTDVDKGVAALLFGIRKCHKYLTGRAFTIITDQEPLTRIFDPRRPMPNEYSPRYIRAAIALMSYHYDIIYRPVSDLMPEYNENDED